MNAKKVRDVLISYLTSKYDEIRIYREKSIGSSICDVMAVTDKLIGFEIKSDLDNYSRLQSQIIAYSKFFNKNYIVVGEKHINSITEKIPQTWGIIFVKENNISIVREAKDNIQVSAKSQLSILWKLELKNILLKNNMPPYAQREKGYIASEIEKYVDEKLIMSQVANELMHRDYSIYDAKDYTVYSNSAESSELPAMEMVDMLSESNLSEFTLDKWIDIYKKATEIKKKKEVAFTTIQGKCAENVIPYTEIEVSLGVPWIDKQIINDFIYHILEHRVDIVYGEIYKPCYVNYEEITGNWQIGGKQWLGKDNTNAEVKYGLKRYNALYIIEATLNLREIKLLDDNKKYCEKDTLLALEKQRLINEEFKRWIWEDEDRRWMIENAYNKIFSKYKRINYDGSELTFPNMSENFALYEYQKNAVKRIIDNKNTLLAFDVGAGKTYIMIAAAMKMRTEGLSRKNLFVVPNHIVGQWEKIFSELYPTAKILAIEPKTFKPEMRNKVLRQIRDGDYDGIIIAYSCFEMIPLSRNVVLSNMQSQLNKLNDALREINQTKDYFNYSKINADKEKIIKLTNDFLNSMTPPNIDDVTFDELEINTLFLDEAHNYKNLPIKTKLTDLRGINTKGSNKCLDMLHKIRSIQSSSKNKGVVFATGTPLCNSIADAYAMQVYLQYDELERTHLDVFDNWVKTFARPEQVCEIDVDTSKFRFVRRFSTFFNLPELSNMFSQITDFYANSETSDLPTFSGYTDVILEKSKELNEYMIRLSERTEAIRNGDVHRSVDNMLKVSTDGRKAALDLSLVGKEQVYDEKSKVYRCVENVIQLYKNHPETTQLIFCDYSTPKADEFNVYAEIRDRLIKNGIPKTEIAFIHSYNTESRKVELFQKFNEGKVRILIGSTFKLGTGANVQTRLKVIHHLDVPWRPADMVQREGRIIRRGNENSDVLIYRYIAQGSFDAYSWQVLENKQKFISQFLSGSTYQRSTSDLENNILTYAQVKALAISQPLMKMLIEKENEVKELKLFIAKEIEETKALEGELKETKKFIPSMESKIRIAKYHNSIVARQTDDGLKNEMRKISSILTQSIVLKQQSLVEEISIFGFVFSLPEKQNENKPYGFLSRDDNSYVVELGNSASGNAKRIIGVLKRLPKRIKEYEDELADTKNRISQIEKLLTQKSSYKSKLLLAEREVEELRSQIQIEIS